jgi:hypothetical protein
LDAFFKMGKTVQRIQPESKMPEEEEPTKRPGVRAAYLNGKSVTHKHTHT